MFSCTPSYCTPVRSLPAPAPLQPLREPRACGMAGEYKKVRLRQVVSLDERESGEARWWRKFRSPVVARTSAPAVAIEASPAPPHDYAVTAGARITLYDSASNRERRAISKFKDLAYCGSYRGDGRLLVAGGARPLVQVFDLASRSVLRSMKGHEAPVHITRFTADNTHVFSTSDDRSLRYWDMATGEAAAVIEDAHADYIRAGVASSATPSLLATGSYDHTARLWDLRLATGGSSAASFAGDEDEAGDYAGDNMSVEGDEDDDIVDAVVVGHVRGEDDDDEEEEEDAHTDDEDASSSEESEGEDEEQDAEMGDAGAAAGSADADDHASSSASRVQAFARGSASAAAVLPRGCVLSVDHGEPVTQVLLLPGGGTMLTAGGNYVRLWDVVGGGRCLHTFSNHQKLITTMCLDGTGTRLLTGSLDGLVKVYEVSTFGVTHTMRYDAPILSMAISPDNSRLIVGCTDDTLTIKQRMVKVSELVTERKSARLLRGGTYRYFLRGQSTAAAVDDIRINKDRKPKLQAYDQSLKHFQYADALDTALASHDPIVISSLLEELIARDGLLIATGGRTEESLEPLLAFLVKYVAEPRFASLLLDVANGT